MSSNSRLDELKQQVRDTSNLQMLLQMQRNSIDEEICNREYMQSDINQEMMQLVRSVFEQNEIAEAKERAFLKDKIEHFGYKQDRTTEAIIQMKDELAALKKEVLNAINAHKEAYELKSRRLEEEFEQKRKALESKYELLDTENLESNYNLTTESKETLKNLRQI